MPSSVFGLKFGGSYPRLRKCSSLARVSSQRMGSVQYWCSSGRAGGTDAGAMRKGRIQRPGFGFRGRRLGKQEGQGRLWQRSWDEKRVWEDTRKRRRTKRLIGARPALARRRGPWGSMQRGAIFGVVLVASGNRGNNRGGQAAIVN